MKIAVLGTRGIPAVQGGVETYCLNLYPRLVQDGCEVILFTRKPYVDPSRTEYKGVQLYAISCPRSKYLEAIVHTLKSVFVARRFRPDVLHIHALGPSLVVPLARLLRMKVVVRHVGSDYDREKWGLLGRIVLRLGETCAVRWANGLTCVSEYIADHIRSKYRCSNVDVIPNGVPSPRIWTSTGVLDSLGLEPKRYVLSVGRMVPEKGFHVLVDAFLKSCSRFQWKLVLIGSSDHESSYSRELLERCNRHPDILVPGKLTGQPIEELYSHAGLFVLASSHEGMSFSLLEALSYGIECLASDIPANRAVGIPDRNHFPPRDVDALGALMARHMEHPDSPEVRLRLRERICREHDWSLVAKETLTVLRRVASQSPASSTGSA